MGTIMIVGFTIAGAVVSAFALYAVARVIAEAAEWERRSYAELNGN